MEEFNTVIAFIGLGLCNLMFPNLTIPYAIIAGAYIIGAAIRENKEH